MAASRRRARPPSAIGEQSEGPPKQAPDWDEDGMSRCKLGLDADP
jgi:hypothetical protein